MEEANLVFNLNKAVFDSIDPLSGQESLPQDIVQPSEEGGYSVASVASIIAAGRFSSRFLATPIIFQLVSLTLSLW